MCAVVVLVDFVKACIISYDVFVFSIDGCSNRTATLIEHSPETEGKQLSSHHSLVPDPSPGFKCTL